MTTHYKWISAYFTLITLGCWWAINDRICLLANRHLILIPEQQMSLMQTELKLPLYSWVFPEVLSACISMAWLASDCLWLIPREWLQLQRYVTSILVSLLLFSCAIELVPFLFLLFSRNHLLCLLLPRLPVVSSVFICLFLPILISFRASSLTFTPSQPHYPSVSAKWCFFF